MKKTSKALLLGLCALLLVGASVLGTMAYLTSTTSVTNTFTVGKVEIDLDEAKVDENGTEVPNVDRVKANDYKLMPGHEYKKDPTVHVKTGSEDCYLFVKVSNDIAAIETSVASDKVSAQIIANGWKAVENEDGVYVYTNGGNTPVAVSAGTDKLVFSKFIIDGAATSDTLKTYVEGKKITINAYAVQADGFANKSIAEIWSAAKN